MPEIFVKWGREKLEVSADLEEAPLVLKSQLFALTGVTPDRQKIVVKGKMLGDDAWNGISLTDGATIMMMGSIGEIPTALVEQPKEVGKAEPLKKAIVVRGLQNLGNTCYMNSVLQSLLSIPELRKALERFDKSGSGISAEMSKSVKDACSLIHNSSSSGPVIPMMLLQVLHRAMPHFALKTPQGVYEQQDANECFVELQRLLLSGLKQGNVNIESTFKGRFKIVQNCLESPEEAQQVTSEDFYQLSCFLSQEVKYIQTGIKEKLTEEIVKNSSVLGRDAKWQKKVLIDRLPAYLSVQMVRFFYKEKAKVNAKILKDVKFPLILDLYEMCTPELQAKMKPHREAVKADEDARIEEMRERKLNGKENNAIEEEKKNYKNLPFSFPDDEGSNNSGFYHLQAVITHKGRSSNGGHYVAWIRVEDDKWIMCDDDEVHPVTAEQVLNLSGGGDWHTAYVLVYGPRVVREYNQTKSEETDVVMADATN